ncbi:MAG: flagellar motor switch protein FliM, partial [Oscillospiraceae bacterium]|nr:flagellar motor switch protein FliM [Oscillospiraceae bacterium]
MSDVLSQAEIDALLNKFDSGEMDLSAGQEAGGVKVRDYDFRTANRFHKEQIRTLNIIYETFARLLSNYMSGTLRVMASVDVLGIEELKYQEFINALPSPVILAVMRQPPLAGPILFEISPDIAYSMISRLLGGQPTYPGGATREFTEIELVLVERMLRQFMPLFVEGWTKVMKTSISLDRIETNPQFAQIVASNETVAIISLSVRLGETEGLVNVCLPHLALEPVNNQLSTKLMYQSSESQSKEPVKEDITARIARTQLSLAAVFNATDATVREILELSAGDVLRLDHTISEPLTLMVGHLPKFKVGLGVKDKRYAVKVSEVIRKED